MRTPRPPPTLIFSQSQPIKILILAAILFSIVEKHKNYVFGADLLPHSPKGIDQCLHTVMVIGKCTDAFWGIFLVGGRIEERGLRGRIFPWKNFSWGKKDSMKRVQDFLAFLKSNEKINMKKFFSTESKGQH